MSIKFKNLITLIFTLCLLLGLAPLAYAEADPYQPPSLKIVLPSPKVNTHVDNTPQFGDELTADVYPTTIADEQICWYRFYNEKKDAEGKIIQEAHYELIGKGRTYTVKLEDLNHCLKCTVDDYSLVKETNPVAKKNYGKPDLKVKDNSYYGDTDGCVYYLDQRMQYTHDGLNIFDVTTENSSLFSGENLDSLDKNGYSWMVRYKGSYYEEESEWVQFTIKPGQKINLESVSITESAELNPLNNTLNLIPRTYPDHSYIATYDWSSSDESVATVDNNGKVTAVSNGEAIITCIANKGGPNFSQEQMATCTISVKDFDIIYSADIEMNSLEIDYDDIDKTQTLAHSIFPANIKNYTESWTSSDESVVSVKDGMLMPYKPGDATITYSVTQNGKTVSDTITVSVKPEPSAQCVSKWSRASREDLVVNFLSFPVDSRLKVTIDRPGRGISDVPPGNYTIVGNTLTMDFEYLYLLGTGDFTLYFTMPEQEASSESGIVSAATKNSNPGISLLGLYEGNAQITSVSGESGTNTNQVSATITIQQNGSNVSSIIITPDNTKVTVNTDISYDSVTNVQVDPSSFANVIKSNSSGKATFDVTPYINTSTDPENAISVKNGTGKLTITYGSGNKLEIPITIKEFLQSDNVTFAKDSVYVDYTYREYNIYKDLTVTGVSHWKTSWKAEDYVDTYYGRQITKHVEITDLSNDGKVIVRAYADTHWDPNIPVPVKGTVTQTFNIDGTNYTNTVTKSVNFYNKLFAVTARDHNGQWEALGKVGMKFTITGIESVNNADLPYNDIYVKEVYYSDAANPDKGSILIHSANESAYTKYGYTVGSIDYYNRSIPVTLSYLFMRTLHIGTYNITFYMYDGSGNFIGIANSTFQVLPKGTPLTSDTFNALPYVILLALSLGIPTTVITLRNIKKRRTKYQGKH